MMKRLACVAIVLAIGVAVSAQTKYGVTVVSDKGTDFAKLKTYVWQSGWDSSTRQVHEQIVAAVDRELKALGFTLKASGPSDVVVKYASLRRIDVEVNTSADINAPRRQFDVGSLVLLMLEPNTRKELFRARVDKPLDADPGTLTATINTAVAEIFAKYPTRKK